MGRKKKPKFVPAELTFTIFAEGLHYEYFTQGGLKNIFDNLPIFIDSLLGFWVVVLGLYMGARVGEIAGMRTEYVFEKSGLQVMRLAGIKTVASNRTIPIHKDLVRLGFFEYVESRRKANKELLFDTTSGGKNGSGAQASKLFTAYKTKIGIHNRYKAFHSFRHTIVDHLKQAGAGFEARCQHVEHGASGGVNNSVYGRNEINLLGIETEVVDKINWVKYCGWEPDFELLKKRAYELLKLC